MSTPLINPAGGKTSKIFGTKRSNARSVTARDKRIPNDKMKKTPKNLPIIS